MLKSKNFRCSNTQSGFLKSHMCDRISSTHYQSGYLSSHIHTERECQNKWMEDMMRNVETMEETI